MEGYAPHRPVMAEAVINLLVHNPAGTYLDTTAGGGGHTAEILKLLNDRGRVLALDKDPDAMEALMERFSHEPRVQVLHADFRDLLGIHEVRAAAPMSGIMFDFGVSSHMFDGEHGRGFSHRHPGALDMRMNPQQELTAADVVNSYSEQELSRVLARYGEEPRARKIARAIVRARPLANTETLAEVVRGAAWKKDAVKSVSRVFQAIRIEVNDELGAIRKALPEAVELLEIGGHVLMMSYHSLEDRIVKRFIVERSRNCTCPPELPVCVCGGENATLEPLLRRVMKADDEEIAANPRSRSVRVRAARRIR